MQIWKRSLCAALAVLVLAAAAIVIPATSAHADSTIATGYVNTSKLNMRKTASGSASVVKTLSENDSVNIYGVSGSWLKIGSGSSTGYVSGRYITVNSSSLSGLGFGYTNAGVNLRSSASSSSSSKGIKAKGTGLIVYSLSGSWYKVKVIGGSEGYMYKQYVTLSAKTGANGGNGSAGTTAAPIAKGYINATEVSFRTGPGTSNSRITRLAKNTAVTIYGSSGNWYQLKVDSTNKEGYVYKQYVSVTGTLTPTPTPVGMTPSPTPIPNYGYVNATDVNFRTGPGSSTARITKLSKPTAVTILGSSGNWYKISVKIGSDTKEGYMYKQYITLGSTATPTPTVKPTATPVGWTPSPTPTVTATPTPTPAPTTYYISRDDAPLMSKAGSKSTIQLKLNLGTPVYITATPNENWYQIKVISTGKTGYVYQWYVSPTKP